MQNEQRQIEVDESQRPTSVNETDAERREMLARLGKMAALTAPAMVTLMLSKRASAASP